ncbi:putative SAM-dependent methyltransferase [Scopulibacillus darangshiensis]|uniref:Putative SAM-dependent methyltransferase n=1 Tax=Scopulibacillus darangshiensis TaxID=442528 RepID=A0A4R2P5B7_9BACL|nr:SAM-dependent methyltransferase [Scopulibacillus darangshiensis]TCP29388.1 putative SAM-dependent methyltransferase [Scopulibacillus darangshiensis]
MNQKDIKVVIGAGEYRNNPGWIHTKEEELNLLNKDDWDRMFKYDDISAILAEHVWEHLSFEDGIKAARMCYDYLRPNGYIRCAVPDGFFPNESYQNIVKVGGPGPKDHPAASHRIVYNYKTFTKMFHSAGYEVRLLEYFDEDGQFRCNDWNGADGVIFRSKKFDPRNQGGKLQFPSLILDAIKTEEKG